MKPKVEFTSKDKDAARSAWNSGKKKITLNGIEFKMRKLTHKVNFQSGGESKSQVESWLLVTPVEGVVPMMSLDLGNPSRARKA